MAIILTFLICHWYLSGFSQSFFLHRYSSHKMFTLSPFWEKFFYLFTFLTQGSSYLNPRSYAIMHRMHHAFSDTEKDPHSPKYAKNPMEMMWKTVLVYREFFEEKGRAQVDKKFLGDYPVWSGFDRWADRWEIKVAWVVLYTLFYMKFATAPWQFLLLPIHYAMGPVHGAIVNWCGHKYGYVNFDNHDQSKNTLGIDVLAFGELMQNNHHRYANRPNFAVKWFEMDPTYAVMMVLEKLRIIAYPA